MSSLRLKNDENIENVSKARIVDPIIKNGKMYLYHVCMEKDLKKILRTGLDSEHKRRTTSSKNAIYLTNNPGEIAEGDDDFYEDVYPVLIVDVTDFIEDLELDPEYPAEDFDYGDYHEFDYYGAFMYYGKISPSKIEHYGYLVHNSMGTRDLVKKDKYNISIEK